MQQGFHRNQLHLRSWTQPRRLTCLEREERGINGTRWSGIELQRSSPGRDSLASMA